MYILLLLIIIITITIIHIYIYHRHLSQCRKMHSKRAGKFLLYFYSLSWPRLEASELQGPHFHGQLTVTPISADPICPFPKYTISSNSLRACFCVCCSCSCLCLMLCLFVFCYFRVCSLFNCCMLQMPCYIKDLLGQSCFSRFNLYSIMNRSVVFIDNDFNMLCPLTGGFG